MVELQCFTANNNFKLQCLTANKGREKYCKRNYFRMLNLKKRFIKSIINIL